MFLLVQASSRSRARPYRPSTAANHEDRSAHTLRASKPPFPFLFSLLLPTPLATRRGFTSDARRETWKRRFNTQLRNLARCSRGGETRGTVFVILLSRTPTSLLAARKNHVVTGRGVRFHVPRQGQRVDPTTGRASETARVETLSQHQSASFRRSGRPNQREMISYRLQADQMDENTP